MLAGKTDPGRGKGKCKGPEGRTQSGPLRGGEVETQRGINGGEGHLGRAWKACVGTLAFTLSENTREGFEQRQGGLIWDQEYHQGLRVETSLQWAKAARGGGVACGGGCCESPGEGGYDGLGPVVAEEMVHSWALGLF